MEWLGNREIQSATMLLVVKIQSALIPTGLLIMMAHWRMPLAFPVGNFLAPFWINALDSMLLVKKSAVKKSTVGYGS